MKITFNATYPKFGNYYCNNSEVHVFAHDDSMSQERRQEIRRHMDDNNPLLKDETQEYKRLLEISKRFVERKKFYSKLVLPQFREFEPGCIRGGGFDPNLFGYLHDIKGVKRAVALAPDDSRKEEIEQKAKAAGIEYFPSKVVCGENKMILQEIPFMDEERFARPILDSAKNSGMSEENLAKYTEGLMGYFNSVSRNYIDNELIPFINTMKKGNVYMACQYGTFRTDTAISLNSWFNPECEEPFKCLNHGFDLYAFRNLKNKLTDEDKAKLGFTPEFEEKFDTAMEERLKTFSC